MPTRVMMTTESLPRDVFQEWQLVHDTPHIVGEFVWTAMDYLGESGIGGWRFGTPERATQVGQLLQMVKGAMASFGADGKNPFPVTEKSEDPSTNQMMSGIFAGRPYHGAVCGDIDLTGHRKPQSYYRDILWNRGNRVYAAVRLPEPDGQRVVPTVWSVSPTSASWTWPGREGQRTPGRGLRRHREGSPAPERQGGRRTGDRARAGVQGASSRCRMRQAR